MSDHDRQDRTAPAGMDEDVPEETYRAPAVTFLGTAQEALATEFSVGVE